MTLKRNEQKTKIIAKRTLQKPKSSRQPLAADQNQALIAEEERLLATLKPFSKESIAINIARKARGYRRCGFGRVVNKKLVYSFKAVKL